MLARREKGRPDPCARPWSDRGPFCDARHFAAPPDFPLEILPEEPEPTVVAGFGGAIARPAPVTP